MSVTPIRKILFPFSAENFDSDVSELSDVEDDRWEDDQNDSDWEDSAAENFDSDVSELSDFEDDRWEDGQNDSNWEDSTGPAKKRKR
ncbi:hypothetical protein CDAR_522411 [Caerostris darwini]|uniref:Uncharacterized protein n=1 Tax=Caerostris darwini TaxID=1538125 RepID=A0AAV4VPM8_9ARAC|nr:hypothetical protein CDAR_522411 [Caerostris darwini]